VGSPDPRWYDEAGNVYVGRSEAEVRAVHDLGDMPLRQEPGRAGHLVLLALWTFSTLGWPRDTAELRTFHPPTVLVTGFDIIFFWSRGMVMMTLKFMDECPFRRSTSRG